jgi:hypothetical protein
MKHFPILGVLAVAFLALAACDRNSSTLAPAGTPIPEPVAKTKTLETSRLADEIDRYDREPTAENAASVKKALASIDGEIAELQGSVARGGDGQAEAAAKVRNLESYRETQAARFAAMQAKSGAHTTSPAPDGRSGSDKAEAAAREAGVKIEEGARKAGNAVGNALERAGNALKDASK